MKAVEASIREFPPRAYYPYDLAIYLEVLPPSVLQWMDTSRQDLGVDAVSSVVEAGGFWALRRRGFAVDKIRRVQTLIGRAVVAEEKAGEHGLAEQSLRSIGSRRDDGMYDCDSRDLAWGLALMEQVADIYPEPSLVKNNLFQSLFERTRGQKWSQEAKRLIARMSVGRFLRFSDAAGHSVNDLSRFARDFGAGSGHLRYLDDQFLVMQALLDGVKANYGSMPEGEGDRVVTAALRGIYENVESFRGDNRVRARSMIATFLQNIEREQRSRDIYENKPLKVFRELQVFLGLPVEDEV